jgi:hypothetical protein
MTECVSRERLVELLSSLDHPALPTLDHLTSCATCRGEITSLQQLRGLLRPDERLPAGFVDRVMVHIEQEAANERVPAVAVPTNYSTGPDQVPILPRKRGGGWRSVVGTALVALMSGAAASVVLSAGPPVSVGYPAVTPAATDFSVSFSLLVGLLAAAGFARWERGRSRAESLGLSP